MTVTAVAGGTIVAPGGTVRGDLLIRDGTVDAIGSSPAGAAGTLDATGCYVLPGGVDPHTHLMPAPALAAAAAARGGTTTALSFTGPRPGESDLACLLRSRTELGAGGFAVDIGLHAALYDPGRVSASDLDAIRRAGAAAIKVFLAYPELGIMCSGTRLAELMDIASQVGLVVAVHCENARMIEARESEAAAARAPQGARIFADTRPPEAEDIAVAQVLASAARAGAVCYLVHLSTQDAIRQVRLARTTRRPAVFAEVCTHHLMFDDGCYERPDAGRFLVAPPLRPASHVEALWAGLADATIDAVGSDHCQARTLTAGRLADAGHSHAYGLAGIGARLPLLLSAAMSGRLPITEVARLAAENPARAFGHYPRKGTLQPGSDADVVIFDPAGQTVLPVDGLGDGTGDSVYAGRVLRGRIRAVLRRGRLIVSDGELTGEPAGTFLAATMPA